MSDTESECPTCERAFGGLLDLTRAEADALYEHIMRTEQEAEPHIAKELSNVLEKLPEQDILTRNPPAQLRAELLIDRPDSGEDSVSSVDGGSDE
jgi:hypothetical protein